MLAALLADTPALPLGEGGKYVAGAYIVFVVLLVVYVAIMGSKLQRIERELGEVAEFAEQRRDAVEVAAPVAATTTEKREAAPGRGSEGSSIPDPLPPHGSGGGGA